MKDEKLSEDEEIQVRFKGPIFTLNQFDHKKYATGVVTDKRIYIFRGGRLRRAHWISKIRGIII